jgi:uncharacterized protein (TIGR03086 family)
MDELSSAQTALTALQRVVHLIGDDDLGRPTPCPAFDVAALADHLVDFIARPGKSVGIHISAPDGSTIEQRILQVERPVPARWRQRGLSGDVVFGSRTLPAWLAAGVLSLELIVHGWNFAVATDRSLDVSDAHADYVLGLAEQTLTPQSRTAAAFDEPVPVPAMPRGCRFPNFVTFPEPLTCGDAGCPTACHLRSVPYSCHFLRCVSNLAIGDGASAADSPFRWSHRWRRVRRRAAFGLWRDDAVS